MWRMVDVAQRGQSVIDTVPAKPQIRESSCVTACFIDSNERSFNFGDCDDEFHFTHNNAFGDVLQIGIARRQRLSDKWILGTLCCHGIFAMEGQSAT
jgi:hypothetical protein